MTGAKDELEKNPNGRPANKKKDIKAKTVKEFEEDVESARKCMQCGGCIGGLSFVMSFCMSLVVIGGGMYALKDIDFGAATSDPAMLKHGMETIGNLLFLVFQGICIACQLD